MCRLKFTTFWAPGILLPLCRKWWLGFFQVWKQGIQSGPAFYCSEVRVNRFDERVNVSFSSFRLVMYIWGLPRKASKTLHTLQTMGKTIHTHTEQKGTQAWSLRIGTVLFPSEHTNRFIRTIYYLDFSAVVGWYSHRPVGLNLFILVSVTPKKWYWLLCKVSFMPSKLRSRSRTLSWPSRRLV